MNIWALFPLCEILAGVFSNHDFPSELIVDGVEVINHFLLIDGIDVNSDYIDLSLFEIIAGKTTSL